jgi:hypothetical protein
MNQLPFNLRFKIDAQIFSFISNFINKCCGVWNLVSNKTNFAIFGFSVIFYEFCKVVKHTHEITDTQGGGSQYICIGALGLNFLFA